MSVFKGLLGYTRKDFKRNRLKAIRKLEDLSTWDTQWPELENGNWKIEKGTDLREVEAKSLDV